MTNINEHLSSLISKGIEDSYNVKIEPEKLPLQQTNKEFEGDFTLNVFPLLKSLNQPGASKKPGNPEAIANEIGNYVKTHSANVSSFNVIKEIQYIYIINCWVLHVNFFKIFKAHLNKIFMLAVI